MLDNASDLMFGPVFDTVDIGLVVLDSQGCIVGWNEWMARVSRRSARDVLGKAFLEVFPEVRQTRLPDVIDDSFRAGSSSILTHTLNALLPLQGESGEPLLHNIVVRPVSSDARELLSSADHGRDSGGDARACFAGAPECALSRDRRFRSGRDRHDR